ncbi:MAG: response regulator, partial [Magnetococcales bacterium]|nr:response regulator [Magnetococcales bacterium]
MQESLPERLRATPSLQVHYWLLSGMILLMLLFFGIFLHWIESRVQSGDKLVIEYHLPTITHCLHIDVALADMQLHLAGDNTGADLTRAVWIMDRHMQRIRKELDHMRQLENNHDVAGVFLANIKGAESRYNILRELIQSRVDRIRETGRTGSTSGIVLAGMVEALRRDIARIQAGHGFAVEAIHKNFRQERKKGWRYLLVFSLFLLMTGFLAMQWIFQQIRDLVGRCELAERASREACARAETANEAKSRFLANVSHEIRTPLNAILGIHDLLQDAEFTAEQKRYLEVSRKSAEILLRLVNDLLDIAKVDAGHLHLEIAPFSLTDVLAHIEGSMQVPARQKGIQLTCAALGKEIPGHLEGDAFRLQQILFNLVGNAVKFTEQGSVVLCVKLNRLLPGQVDLEFEIRDTGMGIPLEKQSQLFQIFSQLDASMTRRFGGTGLGLAIARQLVEKMGGAIHVESQPGKGSRFWFNVILGSRSATEGVVVVAPTALPGLERDPVPVGGMERGTESLPWRLLVVDDSDDNRLLIQAFLKNYPYRVDTAANGAFALEKLRLNRYDLVLMDLQMPV